MTTDDHLVAAAKHGDADAWRELYRAHAGRLLIWLESRADGLGESPDDLAADAWTVAAEKIGSFHGNSSEFAGWLFGIARHHTANARRRAGRRHAVAATIPPVDEAVPGPESSLAGSDWVRSVLALLPRRERDVVMCLDVLDLDVAATAHALGMTQVAVRVARHRGLKRLRATVPPEGRPAAAPEASRPAAAPDGPVSGADEPREPLADVGRRLDRALGDLVEEHQDGASGRKDLLAVDDL